MLLVLVEVPYHPFYLLMKKNQNDITSNLLDLKRKENPLKQHFYFVFIHDFIRLKSFVVNGKEIGFFFSHFNSNEQPDLQKVALGPKANAFFLDFLGVKTMMQICSKSGLLNVFEPILMFCYLKCPWNS